MQGFGEQSAAWETEELFAENRDSLMRYLRRRLDDLTAAEDLLQESFIRFFQARQRGEAIDQPRAWLFRVAHNLVIDYGRRKHPDLLDDEDWLKLEGRFEDSQRVLEARALLARLPWEKLTRLELECLRLRSEGLRFREVAEALDLSISTVASYIARAVRKLQEAGTRERDSSKQGRTAAPR